MKPRHIKIFWRIVFALSLLTALAASLPFLWPRLFPSLYATDAYRTYADRPGIDATCLHNFPLDDTLTIDVTILQATDSLGWETLKKDFNVHELDEHTQRKIDCGIDIVTMRLAPKKDPTLPMDTTDRLNNNAVAVSRLHHTVSVFRTNTLEEQHAILYYQLKLGLPKNKKNNNEKDL